MLAGIFEAATVVPGDVRDSIRELVEYLHDDEAADYSASIEDGGGCLFSGRGHIFGHVSRVRNWLQEPWTCWGLRPVWLVVFWSLAVLLWWL